MIIVVLVVVVVVIVGVVMAVVVLAVGVITVMDGRGYSHGFGYGENKALRTGVLVGNNLALC